MKSVFVIVLSICFTTMVCAKENTTYLHMTDRFEYSENLLQKADDGDSNAMWQLGYCYYVGKGASSWRCPNNPLGQDIHKAKEYFEKSAKKGNPVGMVYLSIMYGNYQIEGGYKLAMKYIEKAIKNGYYDAYAYSGEMKLKHSNPLWSGKPTYHARMEGLEDLLKGSEMGSALASYKVGYYNLTSYYLPVDFYTAAMFYEKAVSQGLTDEIIRIISSEESQKGVAGNFNVLSLVFKPTITLMDMYNKGIGVEKNYFKAIKIAEQYLNTNEPYMQTYKTPAYQLLERCYYYGLGVKTDYDKALYCYMQYNKTAEQDLQHLEDFYRKGAMNADKYESFENWINNITNEVSMFKYTPAVIEESNTQPLLYGLNSAKTNGVYHIFASSGDQVSTHCYDSIKIETDSIKAFYNGYITIINNDGSEEQPILLQMLKKAKESNTGWKNYFLEAIALDGDGTQGIAGLVYNNWGGFVEKSFKASNIKGKGIRGKQLAKFSNKKNDNQSIDVVNSTALFFYEKAYEKDPDLIIAKNNAARIKNNLNVEPETSFFEIVLSSASSFIQSYNNIQQIKNERKMLHESVDRKKAQKDAGNKTKTTASQALNQTRESNNYYAYEQQLKDMHDGFMNYDDATRKQWQVNMKRLREKLNSEGWKISKSQWEDWNGKR